jgi:hypothetical protein
MQPKSPDSQSSTALPLGGTSKGQSQLFERISFVCIALLMVVVLAGVALGRIPAESVNWMLWGLNGRRLRRPEQEVD